MARPLRIEFDGAVYTLRPVEMIAKASSRIGSPSIWDNLEAQSLLGVEGFGEGLRHLVTEKQQISEIPKGQRFVGRPTLHKLFSQRSRGKTSRDRLIAKAVTDYGYSQMELASFLGLHYSTISRILTASQQTANVKT